MQFVGGNKAGNIVFKDEDLKNLLESLRKSLYYYEANIAKTSDATKQEIFSKSLDFYKFLVNLSKESRAND